MTAAFAVALVGCVASPPESAPSPAPSSPTAAPTPTPTPTPTPIPAPPTVAQRAADLVADMSTREKAASVVMGHVAGTDPGAFAGYVEGGPQSVILMGDNVPPTADALSGVTDAVASSADTAPLIGIDQEGGDVSRLPWDDLPSALDLKDSDPSATRDAFAGRADLLADAGITVNFGVVADVPRSEESFIFRRSYGTDPQAVADRVAAAVAGERGTVLTTLKHFPGHGAAEGDSHVGIPATDVSYEQWRALDAVPFEAGIDAGAELVMTGHLLFRSVDDTPASLSSEWYRILRDDLGFDGVAVTDDLGMLEASGDPRYADPVQNAVSAIAAGADLALIIIGSTAETGPAIIDGIVAAAEAGDLDATRLDEAATRVAGLRMQVSGG
ncbi:glycoside hydrolase family 3 N-terminal domain-containing protein [Microbacterium sp. G2-8]|uniref:glycoside hydrolase family 3 N-terminal domain-containing protein n=1 Tax=Microbacterium sp. G2-8 TaxID=2842454 RepID=UPI001C8A7F94|nr:glycoside hydrolase family 3 N-terminal domain-containing protein [Microbacterium sp. G2-8]